MTAFCSLYVPDVPGIDNPADDIAGIIRTTLTALGYELYDPFSTPLGTIPGKAYPQAVRLFVAPSRGGWTRIIGTPDPALLPPLSRLAPCLLVELDGADARIEAFEAEEAASPLIAFMTYAHEHDCIHLALEGAVSTSTSPALGGIALDALPDDVQAMAQQVDLKKAESMFARLSGSLMAKSGSAEGTGVLPRQPDWNSTGGQRITALMDCLRIPDWREPDFVALRDAYALHVRRQRSANAKLYPGDAETLAAVPDALDYTPIYAGKA